MPALNSSMLSACSYDPDLQHLTITFKNGTSYIYSPVVEEDYQALLAAGSPGKHFLENIKDSYTHRRA